MPRLSATRKLYITESNEQISVFILLNLSVTLGRVDCSPYSFSFFFGLAGHNTLLLFFLPISSSLLSTSCTPSSSSVQPHNIGALEFLLCSSFFFLSIFQSTPRFGNMQLQVLKYNMQTPQAIPPQL